MSTRKSMHAHSWSTWSIALSCLLAWTGVHAADNPLARSMAGTPEPPWLLAQAGSACTAMAPTGVEELLLRQASELEERGLELKNAFDHVEHQPDLGSRQAQPRQVHQRGDGVLLLLECRHGGHHKTIKVLVAPSVAPHQVEQLLDVAGPDVHHCVVNGLQVLLQLPELSPAQGLTLALFGVQTFNGNQFGACDPRQKQVPGHRGFAHIAREVDFMGLPLR